MSPPACITGIGVVSPLGSTRESFRDHLLAGESGVRELTAFAAVGTRSRLAAPVNGFNAGDWIPAMKLRRMDEAAQYALVAVRQAYDEAGFAIPPEGHDRAGVVLGTFSAGGRATAEFLQGFLSGGPGGAPALLFNSTVANAAASTAALELKLRGPNTTVSQKETSGLSAIATAVDFLTSGRAAAIAAGGVDALYEPFYRAHDRFGVFATESPRPFDRRRAGFVLGEGAYVLILEGELDLEARGGRRHATILGLGASGDTVPVNTWPVSSQAIERTIRLALDDARVNPADIGVVYASANGAPGLDEVESKALGAIFGERPVITSIKGAIGECGAASAAACVAACLCGAVQQVPPTTGLQDADRAATTLQLARSAMKTTSDLVVVNSIASGGALMALVLRVGR